MSSSWLTQSLDIWVPFSQVYGESYLVKSAVMDWISLLKQEILVEGSCYQLQLIQVAMTEIDICIGRLPGISYFVFYTVLWYRL